MMVCGTVAIASKKKGNETNGKIKIISFFFKQNQNKTETNKKLKRSFF
jgi:hypothetical protein